MRRQRYRAHLERNGELSSKLILAYDPLSVEDFYRRMGYTVIDVESARKRRTTERPANPKWVLDHRAIREAREFLGLTLPIDLKPTNHAGGRLGAYRLSPTGGSVRIANNRVHNLPTATGLVHRITVKSWQDVEQASRTLWHELCHAMQAERELSTLPSGSRAADGFYAWQNCYARGRGRAYHRKPIEVEAREYEEFASEHPLARLA